MIVGVEELALSSAILSADRDKIDAALGELPFVLSVSRTEDTYRIRLRESGIELVVSEKSNGGSEGPLPISQTVQPGPRIGHDAVA